MNTDTMSRLLIDYFFVRPHEVLGLERNALQALLLRKMRRILEDIELDVARLS